MDFEINEKYAPVVKETIGKWYDITDDDKVGLKDALKCLKQKVERSSFLSKNEKTEFFLYKDEEYTAFIYALLSELLNLKANYNISLKDYDQCEDPTNYFSFAPHKVLQSQKEAYEDALQYKKIAKMLLERMENDEFTEIHYNDDFFKRKQREKIEKECDKNANFIIKSKTDEKLEHGQEFNNMKALHLAHDDWRDAFGWTDFTYKENSLTDKTEVTFKCLLNKDSNLKHFASKLRLSYASFFKNESEEK